MDWKRIARAAMCFLVICCLLFNLSPIRAQAAVLESTAVSIVAVSAPALVATVLIGLGVQCAAVAVFDSVVDLCVTHLEEIGLAQDMSIEIFGYTLEGKSMFGVTPALISAIRTWLFDSGFLKETAVTEGNWYYNGFSAKPYPQNVDLALYPYILIGYYHTDGSPRCIFSSQPLLVGSKYTNYSEMWCFVAEQSVDVLIYKSVKDNLTGWSLDSSNTVAAGSTVTSLNAYGDGFGYACQDMWANYDVFGTEYFNYGECLVPGMPAISESGTVITVADGLSAGTIAGADKDLQSGYPAWESRVIEILDSASDNENDRISVWPVGVPENYSDVYTMTQDDAWSGSGGVDVDPEVQTGTLANTQVGTFLNNLLNPIKTALQNLGDMILDGLRDIFVPSSDYLSAKVDALCAEFSFADSISKTANGLIDGLRGVSTEPPVIYIDLSANTGPYDLGGEVPFLDLRWYAAYKPTVDTIISAFLWACFIWRLFLKLPGIINGASGTFTLIRSRDQEDV